MVSDDVHGFAGEGRCTGTALPLLSYCQAMQWP